MFENASSVPETAAVERFGLGERLQLYSSGLREPQTGVFVYVVDGDLRIHGDLDLDWGDSWAGHVGLFVNGNLDVRGNILNTSSNGGPFLLVAGRLHARNVVAGGAELQVEGDADIDELLLGHYNDGRVGIVGTTRAALIISDDHAMDFHSTAPYWSSHAVMIGMPLSDHLHAEIAVEIDEEWDPPLQRVDSETLIQRLLEGRRVVREPDDPRPRKTLAQWRADLDTDGSVLEFVPREIIDRELCLAAVRSNGWAIQHVPKELLTDETVDAALAAEPDVIAQLPPDRVTPQRARVALAKDGGNLRYVPEALRTQELCRLAVQHDPSSWSLRYIPEELLTPEMARLAVENDAMSLSRLPERLRTFDVCVAALQSSPWMYGEVPEAIRVEVMKAADVEEPGEISPEVRRMLEGNHSTLRLFLWVMSQKPMMAVLLRGLLSIVFLILHLGLTIYVWRVFGKREGIAVFVVLSLVSVAVSRLGNSAFTKMTRRPY